MNTFVKSAVCSLMIGVLWCSATFASTFRDDVGGVVDARMEYPVMDDNCDYYNLTYSNCENPFGSLASNLSPKINQISEKLAVQFPTFATRKLVIIGILKKLQQLHWDGGASTKNFLVEYIHYMLTKGLLYDDNVCASLDKDADGVLRELFSCEYENPVCRKLGQAWPNPSLWPNDPNAWAVCCGGLSAVSPIRAYDAEGNAGVWFGSICANIWDNYCDQRYENMYNSSDCKSSCTLEYSPACGKLPNGKYQTFNNDCESKKEDAVLMYYGRCENNLKLLNVSLANSIEPKVGDKGVSFDIMLQNNSDQRLSLQPPRTLANINVWCEYEDILIGQKRYSTDKFTIWPDGERFAMKGVISDKYGVLTKTPGTKKIDCRVEFWTTTIAKSFSFEVVEKDENKPYFDVGVGKISRLSVNKKTQSVVFEVDVCVWGDYSILQYEDVIGRKMSPLQVGIGGGHDALFRRDVELSDYVKKTSHSCTKQKVEVPVDAFKIAGWYAWERQMLYAVINNPYESSSLPEWFGDNILVDANNSSYFLIPKHSTLSPVQLGYFKKNNQYSPLIDDNIYQREIYLRSNGVPWDGWNREYPTIDAFIFTNLWSIDVYSAIKKIRLIDQTNREVRTCTFKQNQKCTIWMPDNYYAQKVGPAGNVDFANVYIIEVELDKNYIGKVENENMRLQVMVEAEDPFYDETISLDEVRFGFN